MDRIPGQRKTHTVTQRDVAQAAAVSVMTVSNVINGTGKMSERTRQRVQEAIRRTGYVPNIEARRLAGAAGTRIGLIYPDTRTPFLVEVLLAALDAAAARGAQLVVRGGTCRDATDAEAALDRAVDGGSEALLLVPPFAEWLSRSARHAGLGMPAVAFAAGGPLTGMNTVRIDNRAAVAALVEHLVALGHRRIGFVSGPAAHQDSGERTAGFRQAMRRHRLPVSERHVVAGHFDFQSGCEAAESMLRGPGTPPTAIIASNDDMAAGVQWAAQRAGLSLPAALSVAGFDDTSAARRAWPTLTVARQPIREMAVAAVDLLIDGLTVATRPTPVDRIFPHELVVRDSTRAPMT